MRNYMLAIALTVPFCATTVNAENGPSETFYALSAMPAVERSAIGPMTDDQLAEINGARRGAGRRSDSAGPRHGRRGGSNIGVNLAIVNQINICALCSNVNQGNSTSARF
jgi:hypothetical protein